MKSDKSPAVGTEKIIVEFMNGPEDGRVVLCDKIPISIGRGTDNRIGIPYDHLVSRHHAKIVKSEDKLLLCDLNSTNGTFVGGKRVREDTPIKPNKLFRVGSTLLIVKIRSADASPK